MYTKIGKKSSTETAALFALCACNASKYPNLESSISINERNCFFELLTKYSQATAGNTVQFVFRNHVEIDLR